MMIKYIEDLFYPIEYRFLSAFWPCKKFEVNKVIDKATKYCQQHHVKYNVGKIQNIDMKTYYIVFNYIKPENGEIQGHVVWCENKTNR